MPLLGVIGGGNMGRAIIRGGLSRGVLQPGDLIVAEIDPGRRAAIGALGCPVSDDPRSLLGCDQIMLAVKPQSFADVARQTGPLPRGAVVISIMAGLSSGRLRDALGERARVIRVMPNTPCQIGLGASAIAPGAGARDGDEDLARRLFGAIGEVIMVTEDQMYAVTAVSGSGPAYAFLLAEAMEAAAIELGLDPAAARTLVVQTIRGAGGLMHESSEPPAALREAVTSPAGTTAAALEVMRQRGLPEAVVAAVRRARDRGVELDR